MEERSQKIQNYDSTLITKHIFGFNKSKLIWLILSAIIFIGLIVIFYFISTNTSERIIAENETQTEETVQDIMEMEECLEMENFDLDCNLFFSNPDIEEKCEKIENLQDECFYKIAMMNFNPEYCEKINNENLKQDCRMNSFAGGEEHHE